MKCAVSIKPLWLILKTDADIKQDEHNESHFCVIFYHMLSTLMYKVPSKGLYWGISGVYMPAVWSTAGISASLSSISHAHVPSGLISKAAAGNVRKLKMSLFQLEQTLTLTYFRRGSLGSLGHFFQLNLTSK